MCRAIGRCISKEAALVKGGIISCESKRRREIERERKRIFLMKSLTTRTEFSRDLASTTMRCVRYVIYATVAA